LAIYAISAILPALAIKAINAALTPAFWIIAVVAPTAWCLAAVGCLIVLMKLLARMDFKTPAFVVEPDGVTVLQHRILVLPWGSVSKVKFHEGGQFRQTKMIAFHMAEGGTEMINVNYIAGISAKHFFDTVRAYHRKFGPQPNAGGGSSYDSTAWTGLDDE
jgi:hypothetical protein